MKKIILATAAIAALSAGAAQAQDTAAFRGFYAGVHGGGAMTPSNDDETIRFDRNLDGEFDGTADAFPNFSPGFSAGSANGTTPAAGVSYDNREDLIAGARVGYDWQMGPWVIGGLVEYEANSLSDSVSAYSTTPANYVMSRKLNGVAAARLRAGYSYGRYLPYLTAGVAKADIDRRFSSTNVVNTFTQNANNGSIDGFQAGAGVETMVGSLALGLEYLYTSLDDEDATVSVTGGPVGGPFTSVNTAGTTFSRSETDFNYHAVRMTMAYRF